MPNLNYKEDVRHLRYLKNAGFNPLTVIDIGVSNGEFFEECAEVFSDAHYYLFEARKLEETSFDCSEARVPVTTFFDTLLGEFVESGVKFTNMDAGSSVYEENTLLPRKYEIKDVTTVARCLRTTQLDKPIFVKIDTQGSEIDILEGMRLIVDEVEVVQLEVAFLEYNKGAPCVAQIMEYMYQLGFSLYDIATIFRRQTDGAIFHADFLFVRNDSQLRSAKLFWKGEEAYLAK